MSTNWYSLSSIEAETKLDTSLVNGLTDEEAQVRLSRIGHNTLEQTETRSLGQILFDQFKDFMIVVLLSAAVISGLIGEAIDTLIILIIVILNALLGTVQEFRAEKAMTALRALASQHTLVKRGAQWINIPSADLVPGDLIKLDAGNLIPADCRLIQGNDVEVDESSLTGESVSVVKTPETLDVTERTLADQTNILFKGTQVNRGTLTALVFNTGMNTELGKIASLLKTAVEHLTPLQKRLEVFGKRLALSVLAICILVIALGILRGEPWLMMLLTGISLAVAAIPEALPAVVSIALALGAAKMIKINALMRNLPAVETLGSVTYICSDKTGTLTQNKMHVEKLITPKSAPYALSNLEQCPYFPYALALSNDVLTEEAERQGEPTELALCQIAEDKGFNKVELLSSHPRVNELAFDSDRKRMTTVHAFNEELWSFTKGAPEAVISQCTRNANSSDSFDAQDWINKANELASEGYRVLAFAMKKISKAAQHETKDLEDSLSFIGLVALIDPPREEASASIKACIDAGITPVMITGDHPATALAIAKQIGLVKVSQPEQENLAITGLEMASLSDEQLQETVKTVQVYARVSPEQKVRLVQALTKNGEFCSMTGDGVNDAPALKNAHIGVAMGKNGTDVAREASDMVLLDDNFTTIVKAVEQGRRIFDNIRKFIKYTMTSNSGEIWVLLLAPFLGMPIPLLPIHILWINLVTDGLPGLALSVEQGEKDLMKRRPRPPNESIFAHGMWQHIVVIGLLIGGLSLLAQFWSITYSEQYWQTMVFTTLTFCQLIHVIVIRSESHSIFKVGLFTNKPLIFALIGTIALQLAVIYTPIGNEWFKTAALPAMEMAICVGLASVVFFAVELEKYLARRGVIYTKDSLTKIND